MKLQGLTSKAGVNVKQMSKTVKRTTLYPFSFSLSCFPLYQYAARPITVSYCKKKPVHISLSIYINTALSRTAYCPILASRTVYRHFLASRTAYRLTTKLSFFDDSIYIMKIKRQSFACTCTIIQIANVSVDAFACDISQYMTSQKLLF